MHLIWGTYRFKSSSFKKDSLVISQNLRPLQINFALYSRYTGISVLFFNSVFSYQSTKKIIFSEPRSTLSRCNVLKLVYHKSYKIKFTKIKLLSKIRTSIFWHYLHKIYLACKSGRSGRLNMRRPAESAWERRDFGPEHLLPLNICEFHFNPI